MHTKGPWKVDKTNLRKVIAPHSVNGFDPLTQENVIGGASVHPDAIDNARLIAAAPELLEALEDVVYVLNKLSEWEDYTKEARVIIAKAKGEKQT